MQLLFEDSEEGHVECLGLLPGKVKSIPTELGCSIPHMGWNQLNIIKSDCITKNIPQNSHMSTLYIAIMLGLAAIVLPVQTTILICLLSLELRESGAVSSTLKDQASLGRKSLKTFVSIQKEETNEVYSCNRYFGW